MSFTISKRIPKSCTISPEPLNTPNAWPNCRQRSSAGWKAQAIPYHAVVKAAAATPPQQSYRLQPTITDFTYLGGNRFQYTCQWRVEDPPPKDGRYWAFTHFCNEQYGKDGSIALPRQPPGRIPPPKTGKPEKVTPLAPLR